MASAYRISPLMDRTMQSFGYVNRTALNANIRGYAFRNPCLSQPLALQELSSNGMINGSILDRPGADLLGLSADDLSRRISRGDLLPTPELLRENICEDDFTTVGNHAPQDILSALENSGYVDGNGAVTEKFKNDGRDGFSIGSAYDDVATTSIFNVLQSRHSDNLFVERQNLLARTSAGVNSALKWGWHKAGDVSDNAWTGYAVTGTLATLGAIGTVYALSGLGWIGAAAGIAYTTGKIASYMADRLPPTSSLAKAANYYSRIAVPLSYVAGAFGLGSALFASNLSLFQVGRLLGPVSGALGLPMLGLAALNHATRANLDELEMSYGGQVDPGELSRMKKMAKAATYSVYAEKFYLMTRLLLLGGSAAFLAMNLGALTFLGVTAAPVLSLAATAALRNSKTIANRDYEGWNGWKGKPVDIALINAPIWGMVGGGLIACGAAGLSWGLPLFLAPVAAGLYLRQRNAATAHITIQDNRINTEEDRRRSLITFCRTNEKDYQYDEKNRQLTVSRPMTNDEKTYLLSICPDDARQRLINDLFDRSQFLDIIPKDVLDKMSPDKRAAAEKNNRRITASRILKQQLPVAGLISGGLMGSLMGMSFAVPIAYATLLGSTLNYLSEVHGGFHSNNTSQGFLNSLKSSSKDLIGELDIERRARGKKVLLINPHTGPVEHSLGILFTTILSKKPNLSFLCCFDKIPQTEVGNVKKEKAIIAKVKEFQAGIFDRIRVGIDRDTPLHVRYRRLAQNLDNLADYFDGDLKSSLRQLINSSYKGKQFSVSRNELMSHESGLQGTLALTPEVMEAVFESPEEENLMPNAKAKDVFDKLKAENPQDSSIQALQDWIDIRREWFEEYTEEVINAAFEQMRLHAESFRTAATRLRAKTANDAFMSRDDFWQEYEYFLRCYDPDYVDAPTVSRKELDGDEWEVRKVENVSTSGLFRGMTVYKAWHTENPAYPTTNWIAADWTRVQNPSFRYDAEAGTLEASKFLWVRRETVMTPLQAQHAEHLSTSRTVGRVDNDPAKSVGFKIAPIDINIPGIDETIPANQVFYVDSSKTDQNAVPTIAFVIGRDGNRHSPSMYSSRMDGMHRRELNIAFPGYSFATLTEGKQRDLIAPEVFSLPLYDYTLMMDKNDIEVNSYTIEPALLEREKEDVFVDLIHRYSVSGETFKFANPLNKRDVQRIDVFDGNIELSYSDANGTRIIPYKSDRGAVHTDRKKDPDPNNKKVKINWKNLDEAIRKADGSFVLVYRTDNGLTEVAIPKEQEPEFLSLLELPAEGDVHLKLNSFMERDGDSSWLKITYSDESIGFVRCPDGKRPMLFNKSGERHVLANGNAIDFGYYNITFSEDGASFTISDVKVPRGLPVQILGGWARGLNETHKVEDVDNSGGIFITRDGRFTPRAEEGETEIKKGNLIGMVSFRGENAGNEPRIIDLGQYAIPGEQVDRTTRTIEITRGAKPGKLKVTERRMDGKGLRSDSSAHLYNFSKPALDQIRSAIPDLRWITSARVTGDKELVITYSIPGSAESQELIIAGNALVDNFNQPLLGNKRVGLTSIDDIYQGDNERFAPRIDIINGNLRLIVQKVETYEIDLPNGTQMPEGDFVITPSAANSAVKINGGWVPLSVDTPVMKDQIETGEAGFSRVYQGIIKSVIGPQTRFGNLGDISGQYPRDPYFYGLPVFAGFEIIQEYGENFGLNRAKALRAQRGIQSGRTHMMPYELIYDPFYADIMDTNNPYYKKMSNYSHNLWGAGVSEDTQMEMAMWLKGVRMHVIKDMVALMGAEKTFDKYKVQNTTRYNYSEALFGLPFRLVMQDLVKGANPWKDPNYFMSPEAMSEILAGRSWYKYPWAKAVELSSIPTFLLSSGRVMFFPVDLPMFMAAWAFKTIASGYNYKQQLNSIGYGMAKTGLWDNPAMEIGFLANYWKAAMDQFLLRPQFGTFMLTSAGGSGLVPAEFKNAVAGFGGAVSLATLYAMTSVALGGPDQLADFTNPWFSVAGLNVPSISVPGIGLGINIAFGIYVSLLLKRSWNFLKRESDKPIVQSSLHDIITSSGILTGNETIDERKAKERTYAIAAEYIAANRTKSAEEQNRAIIDSIVRYYPEIEQALPSDDIRSVLAVARSNANKDEKALRLAGDFGIMLDISQTLAQNDNLQYEQLFDLRETLKTVLADLGAENKNGNFIIGLQNKYRDEANRVMDMYTEIEAIICVRAFQEIKANENVLAARAALKKVLSETREFVLIDAAAKIMRQLNLSGVE